MPKCSKSRRLKHIKSNKIKKKKNICTNVMWNNNLVTPEDEDTTSSVISGMSMDSNDVHSESQISDSTSHFESESSVSVVEEHNYSKSSNNDEPFEENVVIEEPPLAVSMDVMLEIRSKLMAFLPNNWTPLITNCSEISCVHISCQSVPSLQRSVVFNVNGDVTVNVHGQRVSSDSFLDNVPPPLPLLEEGVNYFVDRAVSIVLKVRLMEVCAGVDLDKYTPAWEHCLHAGKIDLNPFNEIRYSETFRSHKCALLVPSSKWRCVNCTGNVKVLRRKCESLEKAGRRSNKTANVYLTEEECLKS